jgi:NTE family protein
VATEVLTGHIRSLSEGELVTALLASSAIPGVFPPVSRAGVDLEDGGVVAGVPLGPALLAGARSLVVLDAGDVCHLDTTPRPIPEAILSAMQRALRQRVTVEAPLIAARIPILYLPRPCATARDPLDLGTSRELIGPTARCVSRFLSTTSLPEPGRMAGYPHVHGGEAHHPAIIDHLLSTTTPQATR